MRFLADNQIRLNICPRSNVMLGRVPTLADPPIRKLFDAGVVATVNTNDALVFGHGVPEECLSLFQAGVFDAEELGTIRVSGFTGPVRPQDAPRAGPAVA